MARYSHTGLTGLEKQLLLSPPSVRQKHADRLEALLLSLSPETEYSLEFVYFRVTGFRPTELPVETISGGTLRTELRKMLEEVSASAPTSVEDVPERVYTIGKIADRCNVSKRTVYRWRDRGLICRKYRFPDGRVRVGVRQEAMERFAGEHSDLLEQSADFRTLSDEDRQEVRTMARELGGQNDLSLTAAARRIAHQTGRATETIRRILKDLQAENPSLFKGTGAKGTLDDEEISRIYHAYNEGHPVQTLCERFGRSRSSIYRIINKERARELLSETHAPPSPSVPESFNPEDENDVFDPAEDIGEELRMSRLYAYLKASVRWLKADLNPKRYVSSAHLAKIESRIQVLRAIRRRILCGALGVIVESARRHAGPVVGLGELVDEGCGCVLRAIDRFDYRGKGDFERFARLQLMKNFARTVPEENYRAVTPSPGPSGEVVPRPDRISALARMAQHLLSLEPAEIQEEKMQRVADQFDLYPSPLEEALHPVADRLNLESPAVRSAIHRARATD